MSKINPLQNILPRYDNQLYEDLALEHEKILWGAVFHALREITGKDVTDERIQQEIDINENLILIFPEHKRFFKVQWKGDDIIIMHAIEENTLPDGTIVRNRRIDEPWKKRRRFIH